MIQMDKNIRIVYSGSTQGWIPTTDDDVANEVPQAYNMLLAILLEAVVLGIDRGGGGGGAGG